jgi:hypothetical protein
MESRIISFAREKETKNAVRFQEVPEEGQPEAIGSLYIKKWVVGDAQTLTIEISGDAPKSGSGKPKK